MFFRITVITSTSRTEAYLTFSRFFIDEIANSKYAFMKFSLSSDVSDFSLRLIKLINSKRNYTNCRLTCSVVYVRILQSPSGV